MYQNFRFLKLKSLTTFLVVNDSRMSFFAQNDKKNTCTVYILGTLCTISGVVIFPDPFTTPSYDPAVIPRPPNPQSLGGRDPNPRIDASGSRTSNRPYHQRRHVYIRHKLRHKSADIQAH